MSRTILLVHPDPAAASTVQALLTNSRDGPFNVEWASDCSTALHRLNGPRGDGIVAVVSDLNLPDSLGLATFDRLFAASRGIPILVLSMRRDEDIAREAVRRGAQDYLLDECFDGDFLSRALCNMLQRCGRAIALATERAQLTLNSIGDAIVSTDIEGNITFLNPVAVAMTGWPESEALGRPLQEILRIIDADSREPVRDPIALAIESDETVGLGANCLLVRRDGEEFAIEDTASPIHDVHDRVAGAVIVFHDVGVARALSLKMSHLAQHDPLTGLPNRVLLQDRLARAVATARREGTALAVLFIDVDRFKEINDTLGHTMGDHVLQSIAKRLRACTRESDTVSRRSGDEFVVLLPGVAASADGALVAEKVLAAMSVPHRIDQHDVHATVSIGVAICPDHGADADTLLQRADIALADAKLRGRSTYRVYMPKMTPERAQSMSTDQTAGKAVRGYRLALLQLTDR